MEKYREQEKEVVVITGSSGLLGSSLISALAPKYRIVGLDLVPPIHAQFQAEYVFFNLADEKSILAAMERIRYGYGNKIASVIHLAAYYDFAQLGRASSRDSSET